MCVCVCVAFLARNRLQGTARWLSSLCYFFFFFSLLFLFYFPLWSSERKYFIETSFEQGVSSVQVATHYLTTCRALPPGTKCCPSLEVEWREWHALQYPQPWVTAIFSVFRKGPKPPPPPTTTTTTTITAATVRQVPTLCPSQLTQHQPSLPSVARPAQA